MRVIFMPSDKALNCLTVTLGMWGGETNVEQSGTTPGMWGIWLRLERSRK